MQTINRAISLQLESLEWTIRDTTDRLVRVAEQMRLRAKSAVESCEALLRGEPCNLIWIECAKKDIHEASEAKASLDNLYDQKKMLQAILGKSE